MKVSCFTVMQSKRTIEQVFATLADAGYDGMEIAGNGAHLPPDTSLARGEEIKGLAEQYQVPIIAIGAYSGRYVGVDAEHVARQRAELEQHCKLANLFGCDLVRHGAGGPPSYRAEPADWTAAAEGLRGACDLAGKHNVRLGVEIHNGGLVESADDAMKLIEMVGRENLGAIHDAGNMYISSVDHGQESVRTLGDRLFHVHVKDELRVFDEKLPQTFYCQTRRGYELFQATLLDEGGTDHMPLLRGLKDVGYTGYISLECHVFGDDPTVPGKEITTLRAMIGSVRSG